MAEYIDRSKLEFDFMQCNRTDSNWTPQRVVQMIHRQPSADVAKVLHGRWEPREDLIGFVRCSVCHDCNIYDDWAEGKKWRYCPNCGARMDDA